MTVGELIEALERAYDKDLTVYCFDLEASERYPLSGVDLNGTDYVDINFDSFIKTRG